MQAKDILSDPHWFPVHFDLPKDTLTFIKTSRDRLSNSPFLDQRFYRQEDQFQAVSLSQASEFPIERQPISWIFHTAFCASTLMARALDVSGKVLALKEPDILMQLANSFRMARRSNSLTDTHRRVFETVLALLSRRFAPEDRILIKPTNPATYLIQDILHAGETALIMTSPLKTFLTSIVRKGEEGAAFMRSLYNIYALDGAGLSKISERDAMRFTDMQVAAIIWQHQHEDLTIASRAYPHQTRAIAGLDFPKDRERYMQAAAAFLGLGLLEEDIKSNAKSDVFRLNAKFADQSFDATARDVENAELETVFSERIALTMEWQAKLDLGRDYTYLPAQSLL